MGHTVHVSKKFKSKLFYIFLFLQDRTGFFGNGSAFSDLYNVSATGRSQDNLQDSSSRLRENSEIDIKRTGEFFVFFLHFFNQACLNLRNNQ